MSIFDQSMAFGLVFGVRNGFCVDKICGISNIWTLWGSLINTDGMLFFCSQNRDFDGQRDYRLK